MCAQLEDLLQILRARLWQNNTRCNVKPQIKYNLFIKFCNRVNKVVQEVAHHSSKNHKNFTNFLNHKTITNFLNHKTITNFLPKYQNEF